MCPVEISSLRRRCAARSPRSHPWALARCVPIMLLALACVTGCSDSRSKRSHLRPGADAGQRGRRALGSGSGSTSPRPSGKALPSALPEKGPHPDYPTPVAAGTDRLFFLEEPDRGPKPTPVTLPERAELQWTTHAHCEADYKQMICSEAARAGRRTRAAKGKAATGAAKGREAVGPGGSNVAAGATVAAEELAGTGGQTSWRVGRRRGRMVVAESLRAGALERRYVFVEARQGGIDRTVLQNEHGNIVWTQFFDPSQTRLSARHLNGSNALSGCGYLSLKDDAQGRTSEAACLQWLGEPMLDMNGVAATRYQRDAQGFVTLERRFGLGGTPVAAHDGVHLLRYQRDPSGRETSRRYFDAEGRPVASTSDGCAGLSWEYTASGLLRRRTCLAPDGKPTAAGSGVSIEEYRLDERGCRVGVRYLGLSGSRASSYHRIHGMDYQVSGTCDELSRTCLNIVEQPLPCGPQEPARYVYQRDEHGRLVSMKHFGVDGKPGRDPSYDVFELRLQNDELGNVVGRSCYDAQGRPSLCGSTGFHAYTSKPDEAARVVEERFYGLNGAPTTNLGCSVRRFQYDNYDHLFEARNYDTRGGLIEVIGAAVRRELYDAEHRRFAVLLLDKSLKPARYRGCYTGVQCPSSPKTWHAVRIVRAPRGSVTENLYFDAEGQLVETLQCGAARCWM